MIVSTNSPERKINASEALGTLRAWAIVLVVLGHAFIPYMATRIPDVLWVFQDRMTHPFFDWSFWGVILIAMPIFFFSAGFFSSKKLEILGNGAFIKDRAKRVLIPFLVGGMVILPLVYYVWSYGWYLSGRCTLREIILTQFSEPEIRRNLLGPGHLWFLEYLFLISAAYPLFGRRELPRQVQKALGAFPLLLAIPTIVILQMNYDAAMIRPNTFLPLPYRFLYFGYFFLVGAWARRYPDLLKAVRIKGFFSLAILAPALTAVVVLSKQYLTGGLTPLSRLALSCATALYSWSLLLGVIALALKYVKKQSAVSRYLADASFAIYLVHMPIVGLIQDALYRFDWPAVFKFLIVFCGALSLTILFHHTTRIPDYLSGIRRLSGLRRTQKVALTCCLVVLIFTIGAAYQFLYNREKERCREAVIGFYHKYFDRGPDPVGLEHWTSVAVNKWGLERVEQVGFIEARTKGAR